MNIVKGSKDLLYAVKLSTDYQPILVLFQKITTNDLLNQLNTDSKKNAFWINIYNACFQIMRKFQLVDKAKVYKTKMFQIRDHQFSLDDMEHGILRKYRYKYSLGLFPNVFTPQIIKKLSVTSVDYRIHFALNCGAKSCPPIAFYSEKLIDEQLDLSTLSFLEGETTYDHQSRLVYISALFKWYKYDFGSSRGIRKIYKHHLNKDISDYVIKYQAYSWEESLDNYR